MLGAVSMLAIFLVAPPIIAFVTLVIFGLAFVSVVVSIVFATRVSIIVGLGVTIRIHIRSRSAVRCGNRLNMNRILTIRRIGSVLSVCVVVEL